MKKLLSALFVLAIIGTAITTSGVVALDDDSEPAIQELKAGTNPLKTDTDDDGLSDSFELKIGTDPSSRDSDGDGLSDRNEFEDFGTDPSSADTDEDGYNDWKELKWEYDTSPTDPDTDDDGLKDGAEINKHGTNPELADSDNDGLKDGIEIQDYSSDPTKADTDGDDLLDGVEVHEYESDPADADTDGDGLSDDREIKDLMTNPSLPDTDGDGLDDGEEIREYNTSPILADTDKDGLNESIEIAEHGTNPIIADTDSDGLTDGQEVNRSGQNPTKADTDQIDIYVEVDYMEGYKPSKKALDRVRQAYANAPVRNPDGSTGFDLHILIDDPIAVDQRTEPDELDDIMNRNFDHENDGWHYAVSVRRAYNEKDVTGYTIVNRENGQFTFETTFDRGGNYPPKIAASVFMHELGHSVGIPGDAYAGIDSSEVPYSEYSSVMNYNAPTDAVKYSKGEPFDDWEYIKEYLYKP